jgi:hypothetical protein
LVKDAAAATRETEPVDKSKVRERARRGSNRV